MPVRERKSEKSTERIATDYNTLVQAIRKEIDEKHGGLTAFLNSGKLHKYGIEDTPKERAKLFTYLSLPSEKNKDKPKKSVRSFPVMAKLFKKMFNITLSNEIKVVKTQEIFADKEIVV